MVNILYYPENYDPGHYIRIEPPTIVPGPEIDEDAEWLRVVFAPAAKWSIEDISRANSIADRLEAKEIVPETEPHEADDEKEILVGLRTIMFCFAEAIGKRIHRLEAKETVPETEPEIDEDAEHWSDLNDAVAELAASVRRLSARIADRLDKEEGK